MWVKLMDIKYFILKYAPVFVQNIAISFYNSYLYILRHSGRYQYFRSYYAKYDASSAQEVHLEANRRLVDFLSYVNANSAWYSSRKCTSLSQYPILEKSDVLLHLSEISTISEKDAVVSLTGGTTGSSMKVLYCKEDIQERFALLDHFRGRYGYELGKKTAWFSGKSLVTEHDLKRGICYRDDYFNNIRFFSTFHINSRNFDQYWAALESYKPDFIVGFPSSVYDLCSIALSRGLKLSHSVRVFFPTAETVLQAHRDVISSVMGCFLVDQYASSEGAPFILQCKEGALHLHPLTGVFEVVDHMQKPSREGELLVTSFTTRGTPLVRYRIGDRVRLAPDDFKCSCGSCFPVVEYIDGRTSDFVFSPENGRINLGNISNCTKDVHGILCFQVIQAVYGEVIVKVVASDLFDLLQEQKFVSALRERLGKSTSIKLERVDSIAREKSGKFRIVKNTLPRSEI